MKIIQIKYPIVICLFSVLISFVSCTSNFTDYNTNKQGVLPDLLVADDRNVNISFIAQMQLGIYYASDPNQFQLQQNLMGDVFSRMMMSPKPFRNNSNNINYNLFDGWNLTPFKVAYSQVMPQWFSIKTATMDKYPQYYCVATIIKVAAMHRVADIYGPIPYSKFGTSVTSGDYDDLKTVYYMMANELTTSVKIIDTYLSKNSSSVVVNLVAYDKMYSGDLKKWKKFANTLKLRLGMRMVKVSPDSAKKYAEDAIASGVMTDNGDNALVTVSGLVHPLGLISSAWGSIRMSADIESILSGYNDPRLSIYFKTSDLSGNKKYQGIRNAILINNESEYTKLSKFGEYFDKNPPLQIMVCAESYFLRAEARLRGWNAGSDVAASSVQSLYESGISKSIAQWNVEIGSYLSGTTTAADYVDPVYPVNNIAAQNTVNVKWNDADAYETKLQKIITQKWIAVFPDGQEAWSEYRRTGYPNVFPAVINNSNGVISSTIGPRRINFSQDEKSTNATAVSNAVKLLNGLDNGATRLWWDVDRGNF